MRATAMAVVAGLGLIALAATVQAAPAVPRGPAVSAPAAMLVRDGCGAGWHARRWRDRWGNWQRKCVPNRW